MDLRNDIMEWRRIFLEAVGLLRNLHLADSILQCITLSNMAYVSAGGLGGAVSLIIK